MAAVLSIALSLGIAWALALPIALHRERGTRMVGLRTLPLVSVASCGYVLMGLGVAAQDPNALARLIQGLMTGIGFIGGGAILKVKDEVQGTATAAAVWATGAVGGAVGFDRIDLGAAISGVTLLTFLVLTPVGGLIRGDQGPGGE